MPQELGKAFTRALSRGVETGQPWRCSRKRFFSDAFKKEIIVADLD
jgi:hypothetical protein